jgi:hypothetical protein
VLLTATTKRSSNESCGTWSIAPHSLGIRRND